jgi:uncharacterized damage-inducible protein DinB
MTAETLKQLYDYGYWANGKLLDVVSKLTREEFTRPVSGGWSSVRTTLVHTMSAEWGWLGRSGGAERGPRLDPEKYPTFESLVEQWDAIRGYVLEFLATLSDDDLDRRVDFELGGHSLSMTVAEMMSHAMIHGTHHRGQVALLLRQLGHAPGNFDLLFHCVEKQEENAT